MATWLPAASSAELRHVFASGRGAGDVGLNGALYGERTMATIILLLFTCLAMLITGIALAPASVLI
jgi:hypothetical protein